MELYFGRVVDHEACGLMWILAALLCLRYWHLANGSCWRWLTLLSLFIGFWTAWPVYIFAGVTAVFLLAGRRPRERRFAFQIIALICVSTILYLLHIRLARLDAWEALYDIFRFRIGSEEAGFPWGAWLQRQLAYLGSLFSPIAWGMALIGGIWLMRRRPAPEGSQWFGRAIASTLITAVLWIVVFQNGSYIHSFWGFYFLAPLTLASGLGLDFLVRLSGSQTARRSGAIIVALAVLVQTSWGFYGLFQIHREQHTILGGPPGSEPIDLIPSLGREIERQFPIDTFIISNVTQSMPLEYYAHRNLIYFTRYDEWELVLTHQADRCRGFIAMDLPGADEILSSLPAGKRRFLTSGDLRFCLWES